MHRSRRATSTVSADATQCIFSITPDPLFSLSKTPTTSIFLSLRKTDYKRKKKPRQRKLLSSEKTRGKRWANTQTRGQRNEESRDAKRFLCSGPFLIPITRETIAVVTGGNRGIGFEITRQLAAHGLTVVLTSRDSNVGLEAAKVLQEGGLNVAFHQLDVLDPLSIKNFAEWLHQNYGGLDILVNNAGVNFNIGSENSVGQARMVVGTNYFGTKNMIEAMIPLMKPSAVGVRIVNVSSRLGRLNGRRNRLADVTLRQQLGDVDSLSEELIDRTMSNFLQQVEEGTWESGGWPQTFTDYSISKLAVNAYTRLMSRVLSYRPEGQKIYINCYCPGWVKTAMTGYAGNIPVEEGADTGVWLALLPDQAITGKFFAERREVSF